MCDFCVIGDAPWAWLHLAFDDGCASQHGIDIGSLITVSLWAPGFGLCRQVHQGSRPFAGGKWGLRTPSSPRREASLYLAPRFAAGLFFCGAGETSASPAATRQFRDRLGVVVLNVPT